MALGEVELALHKFHFVADPPTCCSAVDHLSRWTVSIYSKCLCSRCRFSHEQKEQSFAQLTSATAISGYFSLIAFSNLKSMHCFDLSLAAWLEQHKNITKIHWILCLW